MQPVTEAFKFGKRIGHQYHGKMPMATESEVLEDLSESHAYRDTIQPMLRETAGFENTKHIAPTQNTGYHNDQFRNGSDTEKELLENRVKPAFWHGFIYGYRV